MNNLKPREIYPLQRFQAEKELDPKYNAGGDVESFSMMNGLMKAMATKIANARYLAVMWVATTLFPPEPPYREQGYLIAMAKRLFLTLDPKKPYQEEWWLDYNSNHRQFICRITTYYNTNISDNPAQGARITAGFDIDAPNGLDQIPQSIMDGTHPLADDLQRAARELELYTFDKAMAPLGILLPIDGVFINPPNPGPQATLIHPQDGGARPDNS